MKPRQRIRREHHLVVVLYKKVEHVRDEQHERVRRAIYESPRDLAECPTPAARIVPVRPRCMVGVIDAAAA